MARGLARGTRFRPPLQGTAAGQGMNASVSLATAPWSGYGWSPAASALGLKGGGAATPVMRGSGFSWATIVGPKVGGSVAAYLPNTRGIPMTASFVRRYPGGLRGLGQFPTGDNSGDGSTTTLQMAGGYAGAPTGITPVQPPVSLSDVGVSASTNSNPWYASVLTAATKGATGIAQQYATYANPLYQKSTVALTPQGQVVLATNQPTTGVSTAGVTASMGSFLPLLIVGGVLMMMMRR